MEVIGDLDIDSFDKSLIGERTEGENLDTVSLDNPFNEFCSKEKKRNGKERGLGGAGVVTLILGERITYLYANGNDPIERGELKTQEREGKIGRTMSLTR